MSQNPPCSNICDVEDYVVNEENEDLLDDDFDEHDESDEDTEEASETDIPKAEEPTELKEQVYQDKLASLKKQLQQLKDGTHLEYNRRVKRLEIQYKERIRLNIIYRDYLSDGIDREYILDKKTAGKEFQEKKSDLKENLLADMEEKRKSIECDRCAMELTGDAAEIKPVMTRKLRRRPNDPLPEKVEKRRKPAPAQVNYLLDEKEIESDLKAISRGKVLLAVRKPVVQHYNCSSTLSHYTSIANDLPLVETRIEDGKLLYERRWFHRGQSVYVEGKDLGRCSGNISAIGTEAIWIKKVTDNNKFRIYINQLAKGKVSIKRRAS
ncbi:sin3 histone deacetylase corepressor complex component SDS3 [Copidosoma floridanum]|uniref:sin3 histone deacetylase corepressor complex component SDS3 n=1 Tax=Copidosoma floridanum TaxID=29053 RepID=UPI0006C95ED4|nr:sin3 histone deacetylase corepressor complex component SDS3 [Copidosoma floridanum]